MALVLAPSDRADLDILFIRRATAERDPWSGQMGFPGGRRDPVDRTLADTAIRETLEEIGVDLTRATPLGELDDLAPTTPVLPPILVRPFVFGVAARPDLQLSDEVAEAVWMSVSGLAATAHQARVPVRGTWMTVPAFLAGRHVIWGMTHRILLNFLTLV